jgi:spore germination protein YaaH
VALVDRIEPRPQTGAVDGRPRDSLTGRPAARRVPGRVAATVVIGVTVVALIAVVAAIGFAGRPDAGEARLVDPAPSIRIEAEPPPLPGHEVYGFVPYWEIDDAIAEHLRATAATTVALFSVTHTAKGEIATNLNGYRAITGPTGRRIVADAHAAGRRVDVTWTSFGRAKNERLFASTDLQDRVIAALVALRADLDVDGIAVDVEEIASTDIPAYGGFVGRLRTALRAAAPRATVTVATGAGPQGAALALAATLAEADRIFLMGYDYRTASSEPGASAPISRRDGDGRFLGWSLDLYAAAGVPVERTILGLPLYGMAWPTAAADLGSPKTGRGDVWVPRRNLATLRDPAIEPAYDAIEDVAFLALPKGKAFQSVYFDTPQSLRPKLGLANELGLAGAGFWALGYERGLPDYTALIADFRAGRSRTVAAAAP